MNDDSNRDNPFDAPDPGRFEQPRRFDPEPPRVDPDPPRFETAPPRFDAGGKKTESARFLRVLFNGQVVQKDVVVDGPTRAGLSISIVGGVARLGGTPVMLIGQQKGRDTKERVRRNYGMPKPEGYRKARRLMLTAERFGLPIITLIDTPGAYPGVGSEERNQSEAIARNLFDMSRLAVPVVSCVIGEGGSGGALAIGVCDRLLMLQYSVYSVISPEGCASILWKSADRRELAAEAMGITADRLSKLELVDEVIPEPLGGAHREPQSTAERLRDALMRHLGELTAMPVAELLIARRKRLRGFGVYGGT